MISHLKVGDRVSDGRGEGVIERVFGSERFGPCADVQFDDGRWRQMQIGALQLVPALGKTPSFGVREAGRS